MLSVACGRSFMHLWLCVEVQYHVATCLHLMLQHLCIQQSLLCCMFFCLEYVASACGTYQRLLTRLKPVLKMHQFAHIGFVQAVLSIVWCQGAGDLIMQTYHCCSACLCWSHAHQLHHCATASRLQHCWRCCCCCTWADYVVSKA